MNGYIIMAIVMSFLAALLAIQNPTSVQITMGTLQIRSHTGLLLIATFGLGTLYGLLIAVPGWYRDRRQIRVLESPLDE